MRTNDNQRKEGDIEPEHPVLRQKLFSEAINNETILDGEAFSNPFLEVKTHSWAQVQTTGNLFIECGAWYPNEKDFKPSGIETTNSPYFVFNFRDDNGYKNDVVLVVRTETLLNLIKRGLERGWVSVEQTGVLSTHDVNKGYVVPVMLILREYLYVTNEFIIDQLMGERTKYQSYVKRQNQYKVKKLLQTRREKNL